MQLKTKCCLSKNCGSEYLTVSGLRKHLISKKCSLKNEIRENENKIKDSNNLYIDTSVSSLADVTQEFSVYPR